AVVLATDMIQSFPIRFEHYYRPGLHRKLGLTEARDGDLELAQDLLRRMAENAADFTLTFRRLSDLVDSSSRHDERVSGLFEDPAAFDEWAVRWRRHLGSETRSPEEIQSDMRVVNPAFIPRNHRVEEAIKAAVEQGDLEPFEQLVELLASPYEDQPSLERYAEPPRPDQIVRETFCGT
ncbi:MAG: protein adenylyltransferase SelO family protein, partial [Myxococcales bacterium]|nr:protein adenylyltransferase SelO family protein [Myxococcales bacterium]